MLQVHTIGNSVVFFRCGHCKYVFISEKMILTSLDVSQQMLSMAKCNMPAFGKVRVKNNDAVLEALCLQCCEPVTLLVGW